MNLPDRIRHFFDLHTSGPESSFSPDDLAKLCLNSEPFTTALYLLEYTRDRLLYSSDKRTIMDKQVKDFLEEYAENCQGKHRE